MIIRTISRSSKMEDIPSTSDVLAEHLHSKIAELLPDRPEHVVEKLARVLIDSSSNQEIHMMLGNTAVLQNSVDKVLESYSRSSMDSSDESLAESLHESVSRLEQNIRLQEKITGMILELEEKHIKQLLASPSEMKKAVDKARKVYLKSLTNKSACVTERPLDHCCIQSEKYNNPEKTAVLKDFKDKEELGEILFEKVDKVYPEEATQITGMILELEEKHIRQLLASPSEMKKAVDKARKVYLKSLINKSACVTECPLDHYGIQSERNNNPAEAGDLKNLDFKDKEELGEILFEKVERVYPEEATEITGMLLELDKHILLELIESEETLRQSIEKAHNALASQTESDWSCQLS